MRFRFNYEDKDDEIVLLPGPAAALAYAETTGADAFAPEDVLLSEPFEGLKLGLRPRETAAFDPFALIFAAEGATSDAPDA